MNILDPFMEQVIRAPDRPAIITDGETLNFKDLDERSNALAHRFRDQGLKKGDVVLVLQGVGIPLYVTLLALFRMGGVAMFPEPSAGLQGVIKCANAISIRGFVGSWKLQILKFCVPALRKIPLTLSLNSGVSIGRIIEDLAPDNPALITFTSGSTGTPKGISRSHKFLMCQHEMVSRVLQPKDGDVDLISLPVFVLSNLASGVPSVIPAGDIRKPGMVDPIPVLEQIKTHNVNRLLLPPAFCQRLVDTGEALLQIEKIFTGGGPVFPDLLKSLNSFAPRAEITAAYGSTEAEPIAHISLSEISEGDFAAMQNGAGLLTGQPDQDIGLKIIDDEIVVTGDHVVKTYIDKAHNKTTKMEIDGKIWHKTGDAGRMDEDGRLWLLGRAEAKHGGLYPFCIETAARSYQGVEQAAFIYCSGQNILTLQTNAGFVKENHKALQKRFPDLEISIIDRIPLDKRHNSKIDYVELRKLLEAS